jgi:GNAT superfamily N-acetyltransferase
MEVGEGVPLPDDPAFLLEFDDGQPYPKVPKLHQSRLHRFFYYRRMRTVEEMETYLQQIFPEVPICIYLFTSWAKPPGHGLIPMPAEGERPLPDTHLIVLRGFDPSKRIFRFRNTWGESWGVRGWAALSYDYVAKYCFESWTAFLEEQVRFHSDRKAVVEGRLERRWVINDEQHRRVYGFEVWDATEMERQGWGFVIETKQGLEVEELYVRPEFRGNGVGRRLAKKIRTLADAKRSSLHVFVPFADSWRENEANYPALVATARHLRVQFLPCPVVWAAYYCTDVATGSAEPVEPKEMPARPKSPLEAVLAAALFANSPGGAVPPPQPAAAMVSSDATGFPKPGSEAWDFMNRRRWQLIEREFDEGLTEEERVELEALQRQSLAAVEGPTVEEPDDVLDAIEARIRVEREAKPE